MSPQAGSRLGPYELTAPIGAGGMGEVWRGKDTRLDRSIAVKILPAAFAQDDKRRQRFEREARTISSLSHPHICTLFDVGHEGDVHFLVMELLEGESLADRLQKGALPLDQVVRFGAQIADALSAAHKQGIVHRDLKPGNVMLTKAGAKLLDFGLARSGVGLGDAAGPTELTEAKPLTAEGSVVGTIQYMAPEQLEGAESDARTDIFALGALVYEMATGRRAFEGKSKTSVIAAILSSQPPPISQLQPVIPPALDHVVSKCLQKDPDERWQTARDVASELRWIGEAGSRAGMPATLSPGRRSREPLAWALAGGLGLLWLLTLVAATLHWRERASKSLPVRFTVSPPGQASFSVFDIPAVSPDGRRIVFLTAPAIGSETLWLRELDSLSAQQLPGTEGGSFPFWSPDGRAIAFFAAGELKKLEVAGGTLQTLCKTQGGGGGAWNQNGEILFAGGAGPIFRVSAAGGEPKPVTTLDESRGETQHRWPSFLPDGRHFLYLARGQQQARNAVFVRSLDGSEPEQLVSADSPAVHATPGRLLYVREGALVSQPFDAAKRRLAGDALTIAERVAGVAPAGRAFSVSTSGVLAYRTGANLAQSELVWFDRTGRRLGTLGERADYTNPALSPDGTRVAVGRRDPKSLTRDIWLFDLERGTTSRFTFDPADDLGPVFSPDGTRILFTSDRKGTRDIYWKAATGVGEDEPVLEGERSKNVNDCSPDGRFLVYDTGGSVGARGSGGLTDLWVAPLTGDRKSLPFGVRPFTYSQAQISPDGRWIVYSSDESGVQEIYVQDFPSPKGKWKVSTGGGAEARWRRDGRELFYIADGKLMAVDVRPERAAFQAGVPGVLFEVNLDPGTLGRNRYVVSPDGQRFLIITPSGLAERAALTVVLNWR